MRKLCKKVIPMMGFVFITFTILTIAMNTLTVESKEVFEEETKELITEVETTIEVVRNDIPMVYDGPEPIDFVKIKANQTTYKYNISAEDRLFFEQIISAEAYSFWSTEECLALASVIINRVEADYGGFRNVNTIREVLEQENAFETYSNGRYLQVPVTDSAREAVDLALQGKTNVPEDILFFCTVEYYETTNSDSMWRAKLELEDQIRNVVFFSVKR